MSLIGVTEPTTCSSFPKIFGGSTGDTQLYQIDVFNDYLAMGGFTYDNALTGVVTTLRLPYLALASISSAGGYYWIKALSQKPETYFYGVQFSMDGALLIVHSGEAVNSYILVFNVSSGNILSARGYSDGGYNNYNSLIRSMSLSSGNNPMAYVLSNYRPNSSTLTGQHLFKFDPLIFSSEPIWIKKTVGSGSANFGHLGLEFGRSQNFLYAFSWFNGMSTVSLLDTDGNFKWQYSTPDGDIACSNMIKYKEIDAQTDIIIASSGCNYLNLNKIISSNTSPYPVDSTLSKTYRFSNLNTAYHLQGLYIINQNNVVYLIGDSTAQPYLVTMNFQTPSISHY